MRQYTQAEIDQILTTIRADPDLALALLSSAQDGSQEDLAFLSQARVNIFVGGGKVSIVRGGKPWKPGDDRP